MHVARKKEGEEDDKNEEKDDDEDADETKEETFDDDSYNAQWRKMTVMRRDIKK